jgi:O-methyltransferase involved in polyketide biosynthesis
MDSVSLTSRWVAAARARESERLDRLFDDPLAAALAGSEGFAWLDHMERAQPWGGPALYVVVRTRFFDDFLLHASWGTGARQVVLLAARGHRRQGRHRLQRRGAPHLRAVGDRRGPGVPFLA